MIDDFNYFQAEIKNMNIENLIAKAYEMIGRLSYDCDVFEDMNEDEASELKSDILNTIQDLEEQQRSRKRLEKLLISIHKDKENK